MPLIVGTAGHIDHGKTALVRALTGQDTDRLKEEKARGISIDLGFAWLDGPDGERAGIVDVPGHERFIRNMLAGAHGIDLVLFTVAADDGVMPQTEEHLDILHLLGVRRGIFVITKIDLVDAARVDGGARGDRDPRARHDARGRADRAGVDRRRQRGSTRCGPRSPPSSRRAARRGPRTATSACRSTAPSSCAATASSSPARRWPGTIADGDTLRVLPRGDDGARARARGARRGRRRAPAAASASR